MGDFVGSDSMIALQRSLFDRSAELAANPLLANGGRILNILDPDVYGWDTVRRDAERDRLVALTMVDRDRTLTRLTEMFGAQAEFPFWQAFIGDPDTVIPTCRAIASGFGMPHGWRVQSETAPDAATIRAAQRLNADTGVAPAPAYYLRGDHLPSMLTCVYDADGTLAACASGAMRYHPKGPLAGWFFAGGVSVNPKHRNRGLGSFVNATLLIDSHDAFDWICALEQAKADNAASVGMITRCGLVENETKATVAINLTGQFVTR